MDTEIKHYLQYSKICDNNKIIDIIRRNNMAKMIPKNEMNFNRSIGEKEVYNSLKKLDDEYIVFHSIRWENRNKYNICGEADFIVIHPQKGIVVIEVKSGEIELKDQKWYQIRLDNGNKIEMQDPMRQANNSRSFI